MDIRNESGILQHFIEIAPYIPMFMDGPVSVAITNTESFIFNQPCKEIPVDCHIGQPFPPDSTPLMVIRSGEKMVREVSAKVYGIPFISYAIPLKEQGKVVGCLMLAKSIDAVNHARQSVSNLRAEIEQVSAAVDEVTAGVHISAQSNEEIVKLINHLLGETERMNHILGLIDKLSNSTKILGLNAAIEAARAGEAGRGFGVVAKEIERLSSNTTQAAKEIGDMLQSLEEQLGDISEKTQLTTERFSGQVDSLEEISSTFKDLNKDVKMFEGYIKQL